MSKTLKDRPRQQREPKDDSIRGKDHKRPPRTAIRNRIHHLDLEELDDLDDLEFFERMK